MNEQTNREFDERLSGCMDELRWLYMELYNDAHAFNYFCSMLRRSYDERREPLDVKPEYPLFVTEEAILWDSFATLSRWFGEEPEPVSPQDDFPF